VLELVGEPKALDYFADGWSLEDAAVVADVSEPIALDVVCEEATTAVEEQIDDAQLGAPESDSEEAD